MNASLCEEDVLRSVVEEKISTWYKYLRLIAESFFVDQSSIHVGVRSFIRVFSVFAVFFPNPPRFFRIFPDFPGFSPKFSGFSWTFWDFSGLIAESFSVDQFMWMFFPLFGSSHFLARFIRFPS